MTMPCATPPGLGAAFAGRLRRRREEQGLRKQELAARIGVSLTTIQQYENGQLPKGEFAVRLAAVLRCSLDWLLAGRGGPDSVAGGEEEDLVMVPLVGNHKELRYQKQIIDSTADQVFSERNDKIEYMVGTMIEVPRAAVTANQIAEVAEFFSFGTNDLTQMTLGFSRDDIGKFLPVYLEKGILKNDPFQILDRNGVGQLIREAVFKGRGTRPTLKCGICGEHGGEPSSVEFCHYAGLNYVSCSPFRVPIARLAAAHAALNET